MNPNPVFQYICNCQLCKTRTPNQNKRPFKLEQGQLMSYSELLRKLIGFQINVKVPETLCFVNGEMKSLLFSQNGEIKDYRGKLSIMQIRLFMNDKRRKDQEYRVRFPEQQRQLTEAIVCVYDDGNTQIMTEIEFLNLSLKRREDPYWQNLEYIQNFIRPQKREFCFYEFNYDHREKSKLSTRAQQYMQSYTKEIPEQSLDFINPQQERQYEQSIKDHLPKYLFYKMAAYLELKQFKILNCQPQFYLNDNDQWVFIGCKLCQVRQVISPKKEIEETKIQNQNKIRQIQNENVSQIEKFLDTSYQSLKKQLGMNAFDSLTQDQDSEQFFKTIYPNREVNFSRRHHQTPKTITSKMFDVFLMTRKNFSHSPKTSKSFQFQQSQSPKKIRLLQTSPKRQQPKISKHSLPSFVN
ncbi:hypothetical protein pb186bvf_012893 [Paramecium bursaria]